ncbi:hypothetical protein WR25_04084 [Diploscapter pachys]|uniref:NudC domain-containing protein 1 n=1 Tax=Diploscapter pachys TaxID=2018661 RepID=A0A2A2J5L1_9BILA|nr:hypothetical protein WR25_04084 [Diploscapter pachys]
MSEEKELLDLKVEQTLLDANFDGYKLSLDPLSLKELELKGAETHVLDPSSAQFSIQHLKIFAQANCIFFDETTSKDGVFNFYIITSSGGIVRVTYNCNTLSWQQSPTALTSIDVSVSSDFSLPPTVLFVNDRLVAVSDGKTSLSIYMRDASSDEPWKKMHSVDVSVMEGNGFMLVDGKLVDEHVHLLLQTVREKSKEEKEQLQHKETKEPPFYNLIFWLTLAVDPEGNISTSRVRTISQKGHVEMCTLDAKCENVISIGSKHPEVIGDSAGLKQRELVKDIDMKDADAEGEITNPVYFWKVKDDEITVTFALGEHVKKEDIKFQIGVQTILLSIGDIVLLGGRLGGSVKPNDCIWTVSDQKMTLELTLFKTFADDRWDELVAGDKRGRFEPDPEVIAQAADLLERFTSDKKAMGASGAKENFNADQLEECDMQIDDELQTMYWLNGDNQTVIKQADITGHQLLFVDRRVGQPAGICLRHDVDGVLWSLNDGKPVHIKTFNAFGYVQASKQLRKFSSASPSGTYAVIAENNNHAFVYWQATAVSTDLRNRRTNTAVKEIAKQQVISLKRQEDAFEMKKHDTSIQGIYAADEALFILTKDAIYAAKLG